MPQIQTATERDDSLRAPSLAKIQADWSSGRDGLPSGFRCFNDYRAFRLRGRPPAPDHVASPPAPAAASHHLTEHPPDSYYRQQAELARARAVTKSDVVAPTAVAQLVPVPAVTAAKLPAAVKAATTTPTAQGFANLNGKLVKVRTFAADGNLSRLFFEISLCEYLDQRVIARSAGAVSYDQLISTISEIVAGISTVKWNPHCDVPQMRSTAKHQALINKA